MSQQNILLARAGYEAWNSGGLEAVLPAFDPEITWVSPFPEEARLHGHDGVRIWFKSLTDVWSGLTFIPETYEAEGDDVVVDLRVRGTARASGIEVEMPLTQRWTIKDGRAVAMELSVNAEEAPLRVKAP
jgi:ketosteroid isomerase-like protein